MKPKIFLLSCLSFIIFNFSFIIGTVRYVSKTGSSTPPYTTWETAADSIMECINISVFGDTIYVANGTYKEQVVMIPGLSLIGAGMDSCIIDTRELANIGFAVQVTDSCSLSGFQTHTTTDMTQIGIVVYDFGINFTTAIIEYNMIKNASEGISVRTSSLGFDDHYKVVRQNIIADVRDGIRSDQTNPIITENIIYPQEDGLVSQIISLPTYINNIIVFDDVIGATGFENYGGSSKLENNLFYGRGNFGFWTFGDSIKNNVVFGEGGNWGVGFFGADSDVKNNHVENIETGLYYYNEGGTPPIYQYNNMWNNEINFENFTPDTTNIFVVPMFVDPDSMDFHLQKYSPLINAGDPTILDVDGTRSDIGLYGGPYGEQYHYIDLAPRTPINLNAKLDSLTVGITWNKNTEADFNHYNVYRDTLKNFQIDSTNLFLSTPVSNLIDILPDYVDKIYYKITAVDNQGNESEPSEEVGFILTSVTDHQQTISDYRLYQNYPNPFNPTTKISYRLKERGYVKLYVYDIKGELISVLVNQTQ